VKLEKLEVQLKDEEKRERERERERDVVAKCFVLRVREIGR
jgi:hypothetical protein